MSVLSVSTVYAQEARATLGGKVTDTSQAVIPQANVVVTSDETHVTLKARSNGAGEWELLNLLPGHYHFNVSAPGFRTTQHSSIELQVGDRKTIDTTLEVGAQNETVVVESTTPLIDTSAAVSGTVVTQKELEELPSQTNSPTLLAGLTPGVVVGTSTGTAAHLWSNISDSSITVNGAGTGTRSINYQLDGGTDANQAGQVAFIPPMDAVQEFRVTSDAYDASIGRQTGATINLQLKSGSAGFHGSLYELNQNNSFNARQFNSSAGAAQVHYNEYGFTLGGPVWIPKVYDGRAKKTFFFYNFGKIHNSAPGNAGTMSLPTTLEKAGDFSHSYTTVVSGANTTIYPVRIYDPASYNSSTGLRTEFAGNNCNVASVTLPTTQYQTTSDPASLLAARTCSVPNISPIAKALAAMIPDVSPTASDKVSSDSNNFPKHEVYYDNFTTNALRLDQTWNDHHKSYASLKYNTWNELGYNPFGNNNLLQGLLQTRNNKVVTLDHTWVATPKLVVDLRFNVTRYEGASNNLGAGVDPTSVGFSSSYVAQQALPSIPYLTGLVSGAENGGLGTNQSGPTNDTTWEYVVNATHILGNHSLRYGFQFLNQQEGLTSYGQSGGSFGFGTDWTKQNPTGSAGAGEGSAFASFLIGLPSSGSLPTNASAFYDQHYTGFYAQDDWRVNEKLTFNLGLRWDYERPIQERDDRMWARYDPTAVQSQVTAYAQPTYAGIVGGSTTNSGVALLKQYRSDVSTFVARGAYTYAGVNGGARSLLNTRLKYFQPRVGFAYRVSPMTVLRGGLGRFAQGTFDAGVGAQQYGYSVSTSQTVTTDNYRTVAPGYTFGTPYPTGINAVTGNSLGALTNVGGVTGFRDPNYGRPYTDTASLTLQQQVRDFLVEVGGTLNLTRGLTVTDPLNGNSGGFQTNLPSQAVWMAENSPTFTNGRPDDTLPGNQTVTNPFYKAPYITAGQQNQATVAVSQLLRPNPVRGDIIEDSAKGRNVYYAMNTKVERRYHNGFSLLQAFTWAKQISENNFTGPQGDGEVIERRLSSNDIRFHYTLTPVYVLPFGKGRMFANHVNRAMEQVIGGWELTGIYNFQSGTPVVLPTNTSFFRGGDPNIASKGRTGTWFDTSAFIPYPNRSTSVATIQGYPSWTGAASLPGYGFAPTGSDATHNGIYQDFATRVTYNQTTFGDIRQPWLTDFTLGARKNFNFTETTRLEVRVDAFNALNHPRLGGIGTDPSSQYFGRLSGSATLVPVNNPRQVQLSGKFFF